jgi:small subunit ribosomal protein S21
MDILARYFNQKEGSVRETVVSVRVKRGESVEKALRRLKKIMDKEGTLKDLRAHRYFEKPSEKKRRKAARSRMRDY